MKTIVLLLLLIALTVFQLTAQKAKDYRAAAERGDAEAQYNLGLRYEKGEGVEMNQMQAVYWYKKAAEQGDIYAQFNIGDCFYNGDGVEINYAQAVFWYKKAAEVIKRPNRSWVIVIITVTERSKTRLKPYTGTKKRQNREMPMPKRC